MMINKELLRKIELVVFDLDGTLTNDDDKIGDETKSLVKKLSELGVKFTIATGRLLSAVTHHADALGIKIPLITLDGSLIQRYPGGESVFESHLAEKHVLRALKLADKFLLKVALCHDYAIFYTEENAMIPLFLDKFGARYEQVNSYDSYLSETLEIIVCGDYQANVKHVASQMTFPWTFGVRSSYYKSKSAEGNYYLEIRKMGCSKGEALKKLLKHQRIKMKHTAVIGDWYNDKSLFETEALKIAIANAVPEIKKMADFVTQKTNNEEGVAEFLKMLYQAKKSNL
jgi:Cof subfamily protein (haloacid dehalogenase superfamily)